MRSTCPRRGCIACHKHSNDNVSVGESRAVLWSARTGVCILPEDQVCTDHNNPPDNDPFMERNGNIVSILGRAALAPLRPRNSPSPKKVGRPMRVSMSHTEEKGDDVAPRRTRGWIRGVLKYLEGSCERTKRPCCDFICRHSRTDSKVHSVTGAPSWGALQDLAREIYPAAAYTLHSIAPVDTRTLITHDHTHAPHTHTITPSHMYMTHIGVPRQEVSELW